MKVATWNVNGIRARAGQLRQWLDVERPDVVCLQEIKASAEQVPALLVDAVAPSYAVHWHGHKGYSGVALLVKKATYPDVVFTHPKLGVF